MGNTTSLYSLHCKYNIIQDYVCIPENYCIEFGEKIYLITVMNKNDTKKFIKGTTPVNEEESIINQVIKQNKMDEVTIIIYGKDACDQRVYTKAKQMLELGFKRTRIYTGGMFEWSLLLELYGDENFPTSTS